MQKTISILTKTLHETIMAFDFNLFVIIDRFITLYSVYNLLKEYNKLFAFLITLIDIILKSFLMRLVGFDKNSIFDSYIKNREFWLVTSGLMSICFYFFYENNSKSILYDSFGNKLSYYSGKLYGKLGYYSKKIKNNVMFGMSFISFTNSNRYDYENNNDCSDSGNRAKEIERIDSNETLNTLSSNISKNEVEKKNREIDENDYFYNDISNNSGIISNNSNNLSYRNNKSSGFNFSYNREKEKRTNFYNKLRSKASSKKVNFNSKNIKDKAKNINNVTNNSNNNNSYTKYMNLSNLVSKLNSEDYLKQMHDLILSKILFPLIAIYKFYFYYNINYTLYTDTLNSIINNEYNIYVISKANEFDDQSSYSFYSFNSMLFFSINSVLIMLNCFVFLILITLFYSFTSFLTRSIIYFNYQNKRKEILLFVYRLLKMNLIMFASSYIIYTKNGIYYIFEMFGKTHLINFIDYRVKDIIFFMICGLCVILK